MRMTASWSGSERTYRIQVCGAKMRPNGELPSDQYAARRTSDTGASKKGPSPCPSSLRVLRRQGAAKHKRRYAASRQAPLAFRSLDPFRALRGPDCRRRDEKRLFPLRTKNSQHNPKQPLDRKSPIQVHCELDHDVELAVDVEIARHEQIAEEIESPYPEEAQYKGVGDPTNAANFVSSRLCSRRMNYRSRRA